MSNNFKDLYDTVFEEIKPQIRDLEMGILYKSIQIIFLEDELGTEQIETPRVCRWLNIKPNACKNEDIAHVHNLREIFIYTIFKSDLELEAVKFLETVQGILPKGEDKKMEELKWIVIVACTVVGVTVCIQYLKKQSNKNSFSKKKQVNRTTQDLQPYNSLPPPIPATLCLIVPANIVGNLSNGSSIDIDSLSALIDSASYFVCTTESDADSKERQLAMTNENIPTDSNREVYVRIKIRYGNNLIGKKIRYAVQTNLPTNGNVIVEKIACLRSLTGLESFSRI